MPKIQGTMQVSLTAKDDYKIVTQDRYTDIVVPVQGTDVIITVPKGLVMQFAADIARDQLRDVLPGPSIVRVKRFAL